MTRRYLLGLDFRWRDTGRRHFATIRGMMSFFYMWGSFAGPVLAGATYDQSQSYESVLWGLFAALSLATILNLFLIKPWTTRTAYAI